jgi:hypothetical protein
MINNLLDQKELFNLLTDPSGWISGEYAAKLSLQSLDKIRSFGIDLKKSYSREDIGHVCDTLGVSKGIELAALLRLNQVCDMAITMRKRAQENEAISKDLAFGAGADSTALIIAYLLKTYDTAADLSADEIYKILNSKLQSEKALGGYLEANKYVKSEARNLLNLVGQDGFNPSIPETTDYLHSVLLEKFESDSIPELKTLESWVKQCKPDGHNPRLGKKPKNYKSIFDSF